MATKVANDSAVAPGVVAIAEALAGNAATDSADRGSSHKKGGTMIRVIAGAGATPTATYQIQVSTDNSTWANATYSDRATPTVDTTSTFVITTDSVVHKIIKHPTTWRYIRVNITLNTNVTNTVDVWFNDDKSFLTT